MLKLNKVDIRQIFFNENFLALEIGRTSVCGCFISLDREKRIFLKKPVSERPWGAKIPRFSPIPRKPTPVVACDSSIAYTAIIPVHLIRERIREPLRQVELENLISKAVGKTINKSREEAAGAIGVDELDVMLAKSRVVDFMLDDHQVLNPIGFRAQKIEALVELTFITRGALCEIKRITGDPSAFITELAHAELSVLGKVEKSPIRLLRLGLTRSAFLTREPALIGYSLKRGELNWSLSCFEEAIREAWGVSGLVGRRLYKNELLGSHSPSTSRFLGKLIKICSQLFGAELEASGLRGKVFLDSALPLPFKLPLKKKGITLEEPPIDPLLERFGFSLDPEGAASEKETVFRRLAPFFEHFYDRGHGGMNEWLRKRLNWLGVPVEKRETLS